ncbi:MAG TPA: DUF92 domain-containing protein [Thermoanaerobaculia bacterium]|nr:DUF92 domain-containing protein [Thermoanaerobaculia bacterium]
MPHQPNEILRKSIHIAFGVCAFGLRWLPWWAAALVAAFAVAGNFVLLHRIVGRAVARHERGWDFGIVIYPAAVLALVVVFRNRIEIAGAVWAIMAFGDGFATVAGRALRGPRLPWNRDKSLAGFVAFILFGSLGAYAVFLFLQTAATPFEPWLIILLTVIACAIVESLATNIDDNVTVPLTGAVVMAALVFAAWPPRPFLDRTALIWIGVNTVLAVLGYAARSVDVSGMLGGWLLGAVIVAFGSWQLYLALLVFFVLGTVTTKLGYRRKAARGLAQEKGGRRGFSHAFANTGVSAMLAVAGTMLPNGESLWLAAIAAFATAAADTTASEVGQLLAGPSPPAPLPAPRGEGGRRPGEGRRRTFLPLTLRPVPPGTEGAVSVEGTLAGIVAAFLVAAIATFALFHRLDPRIVGMLTISGFLGSYIESIAGSWNRQRERPVPNGVLNFFNTAVGAAVFLLLR